jgi:hypothetical protein
MAIKDDLATFLRTDRNIDRLNFALGTFKVYPSAYRKDVADAIASEAIKTRVGTGVSPGAGATYMMNYDTLEVSSSFDVTSVRDQAYLVHECTHAHLDIQNFGYHSGHENEAVGYLAEAVFLEAAGQSALSSHPIRVASHRVAKSIIGGTYQVSKADFAALVVAAMSEPHYATKALYNSNGFARGFVDSLLR